MKTEVAEKIRAAKSGDKEAFGELLSDNAGLIRSIASRFIGRGVDKEDLTQIGSIGMIKAIRNFDLSRETEFSTYAVPLIIGEIKRFLRDDGSIKVGREIKRKASVIARAREEFFIKNGHEPTISEIAKICDFSEEEAAECICACAETVSIYEPIGDNSTFGELIGKDESEERDEKIALFQAIENLSIEEQQIIRLRYFRGMTQTETGKILGMTQVAVSRKETKAIEKMRKELV